MFCVVVSDLDGTLLTPSNQLTYFTRKILKLLVSNFRVHFILATGRHYVNVTAIRNYLDIHDYIITANGSRIHNSDSKLIASYDLDLDIIYDLLQMTQYDLKIVTNVCKHDGTWVVSRYPYNNTSIFRNFVSYNEIYEKKVFFCSDVSKIYFTSENCQELCFLEKRITERWGARVNVSFSFPTCLEVMPGGISKGFALEQVVNLLGYRLKDCISFGDGMNDQEMLSMTGKGCIMYNAQKRLKDSLPLLEVIGSNADEAVPHYLKDMYFC
ncbi:cof-like hydrolase [Candidatus Blochmanniella vafra str. BVAF]|uniref:Cof-like hydrolase n=1 Tax=Blochmanniella vafra (strain BVAF) TaxID=859654 RepID=E8Q6I7_BLOVB|nr:Cof-type HAD-IIB family hydrolase [Candidatus Blochmannia vafer]ADV33956.1 cof-like hydrolase [Candidatus Blochmannia vafer str. BVAF]